MKQLPKILQERLTEIYSKDEYAIIKDGFSIKKRKTTFRVNNLKSSYSEIIEALQRESIPFSEIPFLADAFILEKWDESTLWNLGIYKSGRIYIQSISSQIPVTFLDLQKWDKVLDITAAPWSKTTQIASILRGNWEIVAVEKNAIRMEKLKHNLKLQKVKNVKLFKKDASKISEDFSDEYFDKILVDAPCGSEWNINLNKENTYKNWEARYIKKNYAIQKSILKDNIKLLKEWGILVYSTCTLAPEENEGIVHYLLCNFPELEICDIELDYEFIKPWIRKFWKYIYTNGVEKSIRILPNKETWGFFVAKFRKKSI